MAFSSIGDLAMSFQLRRETGRLKSDLVDVSREISTGVRSDLLEFIRGDFSTLSSIQNDLSRMDGYQSVIGSLRLDLSTQQTVLQKLRDAGSISNTLLGLSDVVTGSALDVFSQETEQAFETAIQALNTQVGGKNVFSGIETDSPSVTDAETILNALVSEIALVGATTATDIENVVDTWFGSGGGYETVGYLGGERSMTSVSMSDSETGRPLVTAENEAIRSFLSSLALGALAGQDLPAVDVGSDRDLLRRSGERIIAAGDGLIRLQSEIGNSEESVQRALVEVTSQREALQFARAELIEVDGYEAATELQNAEAQLQAIYALTGRLSRLSLVEYL